MIMLFLSLCTNTGLCEHTEKKHSCTCKNNWTYEETGSWPLSWRWNTNRFSQDTWWLIYAERHVAYIWYAERHMKSENWILKVFIPSRWVSHYCCSRLCTHVYHVNNTQPPLLINMALSILKNDPSDKKAPSIYNHGPLSITMDPLCLYACAVSSLASSEQCQFFHVTDEPEAVRRR